LILVEFTVFEFSFSLLSKCDDDETHKYVHHEEGDDDDVDDEEDGDFYSVVVNGPSVDGVGIHRPVKEPVNKKAKTVKKGKRLKSQEGDIHFISYCQKYH